jgi:hypothetical protein
MRASLAIEKNDFGIVLGGGYILISTAGKKQDGYE